MEKPIAKFHWEKQKLDPQCRHIECDVYDPYKDFRMDPSGFYVLIRPNFETQRVDVAVCSSDHRIVRVFSGRNTAEVYHSIFETERKEGVQWFQDKEHIAYLGKELKKAEWALVTGSGYFQE